MVIKYKMSIISIVLLFSVLVTGSIRISNSRTNKINNDKIEIEVQEDLNNSNNYEEETILETVDIVYYDIPISEDDQDFIKEVCSEYNFDEKLIYQIMYVESRYNKNLISSTNDHGIMQLNANYINSFLNMNDKFNYVYSSGFDVYNIKHNTLLAVRELNSWRDVCNKKGYTSIVSVLECYNRGYNYFKNTSKTNYSSKVLSMNIDSYVVNKII